MKTAFLYAGQGSQHAGMGADLYQEYPEFRRVFDVMGEALRQYAANADAVSGAAEPGKELQQRGLPNPNYDLHRLVFQDPDRVLQETQYTQPALLAFACGMTEILRVHGLRPDIAAGLSLGEYSALAAAGVLDPETAVRIAAFRGAAMAKAAEGIESGMCAVLGMPEATLQDILSRAAAETGGLVSVCNLNCPGQIVIGGEKAAVSRAVGLIERDALGKCIPLRVSGPFHTAFMKGAGDALEECFRHVRFHRPGCRLMFNVLGGPSEAVQRALHSTTATTLAEFRRVLPKLLIEQVQQPVRMEAILRCMLTDGVTRFIEIGPGHALSGFVKKTARDMGIQNISIFSLETAEDLAALFRTVE